VNTGSDLCYLRVTLSPRAALALLIATSNSVCPNLYDGYAALKAASSEW
jgi:hypothetical protein